jgi:hypothetical protein
MKHDPRQQRPAVVSDLPNLHLVSHNLAHHVVLVIHNDRAPGSTRACGQAQAVGLFLLLILGLLKLGGALLPLQG